MKYGLHIQGINVFNCLAESSDVIADDIYAPVPLYYPKMDVLMYLFLDEVNPSSFYFSKFASPESSSICHRKESRLAK